MEHMRYIESDLPRGMALSDYRRTVYPPRRHSAIRRLVSYGLLR